VPEIDPYEPTDPFATTPEQFAAQHREVHRVLSLPPDEAFDELRRVQQRLAYSADHATEADKQRMYSQIRLLAESLGKWWYERDGRNEYWDNHRDDD
jgi:hypothetical protein